MNPGEHYPEHLATLDEYLVKALDIAGRKGVTLDGVLFHAGTQGYYHADDLAVPFRTCAHFRRYVPALLGPDHVVVARPGEKPRVVRVRPQDYWHDTSEPPKSYWEDHVDFAEVASFDAVPGALGNLGKLAYVGAHPEAASVLGITDTLVEPSALMAPLDWTRAYKTEFEIARIRRASEMAARGHAVARDAFFDGASEKEIHWKYLEATGHLGDDLPYNDIIALDSKSAILHYQYKRGAEAAPGNVLLLDAGADFEGYASDITRTWYLDTVDDAFQRIVRGVDALERDLVAMVTPGRPYLEIHVEAHRATARLLSEVGVFTVDGDEAFDRGLTQPFLCHGVGHHLGIQVHDVGGHQAGPEGGTVPPPQEYPFLRNTRILEPGHVVTIEPGIYFIPMLLDPFRQGNDAKAFDWTLIDRLTPFGGVRIEDDIVCTDGEPIDLTRELIAGP